MIGKYGRLPGHIPNGLRDLTWYVAGDLPAPPARRPVPLPGSGDWGMDGNDVYGDCGVAGLHHGNMCVEYDTHDQLTPVTGQQVTDYYLQYTGGEDNGVVLADFLKYVKQNGFYGRTIAAYAPVSISDIPTIQFAINGYGFVYAGIQVTEAMENAFSAGQGWTPADFANSPIMGGHCVPLVGYGTIDMFCVTWGKMQAISYSAWPFMAEEAWAIIWGEQEAKNGEHGFNLAALQADLSKLNR